MMKKSSSKDSKKGLVSSRYAPMYVPNHSWDFFDAFNNSAVSQMAFADNVVSVEGRNLDRYLKLNRKHIIEENERSIPKLPPLPPYLTALLALQEPSGQFSNLDRVMKVLSLGSLEFSKIRRFEIYQPWQLATAIAIAVFRQQREYFDRIIDAYDKAKQWIPSDELVQEVRILLEEAVSKQDDREQTHTLQQQLHYNTSLNSMTHTKQSLAEVPFQETDDVAQLIAQYTDGQRSRTKSADTETDLLALDEDAIVPRDVEKELNADRPVNLDEYFDIAFSQLESEALAANGSHPTTHVEHDNHDEEEEERKALAAALAASAAATVPAIPTSQNESISTADMDFSQLRAALQQLEVKVNQQRVDELDAEVTSLGVSLITLALDIESISKQVLQCLQRSVQNYNASELFVVRYKTFDELTAMLGEGFAGSAAYDDWRRVGVPGVRPRMLRFFDTLYRLAEKRLLLLEELMPIGMGARKAFGEELKQSRWTVIFQGQNLALRVLHTLDFLRKCRELSDWFGPMFYFMANPLMFSFPPSKAYEGLQIEQKVTDLFHSAPHARLGIGGIDAEGGWEHDNYLENFRRYFKTLSADAAFNWPSVPLLPDKESNAMYFRAVAAMFVCCKASIDSSYSWETKFQGKISSLKGQEDNLIGQNNQRVNKILRIPTLEERKPRFTIMRKIQQQQQQQQQKRAAQAELAKPPPGADAEGRKDSVFSVVRVSDLKARSIKEKPVRMAMSTPEVVGATPPPVDEQRAAILSRLMPPSGQKTGAIPTIAEEDEAEAFHRSAATLRGEEEDEEEAMEMGELGMRSLDDNDGIRELPEGDDGDDGNAHLLQRLHSDDIEGTRSSLLDTSATTTTETTTTSSSGGDVHPSDTLEDSAEGEGGEEADGRDRKRPPGKKLTEMGKRRLQPISGAGTGLRSPGAKRVGLMPRRKPSSSPAGRPSSLSPGRKPSSPGEKGIAFRKKKSVTGSKAVGLDVEAQDSPAAPPLENGGDTASHLSVSTTNTQEPPQEAETAGAEVEPSARTAVGPVAASSPGEDVSAAVREGEGGHRATKSGGGLYEKKSTYRMSQRVSFTGMQRLIRRDTDAGGALQLSRIQSLQQNYAKRQTSSLTVWEDGEEGGVEGEDGEGKKTRRQANIVKRVQSGNVVSQSTQAGPTLSSSSASTGVLKSSLKLPSVATSSGATGQSQTPAAATAGVEETGSAGPAVVKTRKTVRIHLSDSGPKNVEPQREVSGVAPSPVFSPSRMLAAASILSEGSLASSDENDLDTPPTPSPAHRPSIIRQRIQIAMHAQGSRASPGARDRVSRVALPVLQENIAAGRSIQGIRPSSQGQSRLTKRRPSSAASAGKPK